jgi:hypothetical protein
MMIGSGGSPRPVPPGQIPESKCCIHHPITHARLRIPGPRLTPSRLHGAECRVTFGSLAADALLIRRRNIHYITSIGLRSSPIPIPLRLAGTRAEVVTPLSWLRPPLIRRRRRLPETFPLRLCLCFPGPIHVGDLLLGHFHKTTVLARHEMSGRPHLDTEDGLYLLVHVVRVYLAGDLLLYHLMLVRPGDFVGNSWVE